MRRLAVVVLLIMLTVVHVLVLGKATEEVSALPRHEESAYVLPSPLLAITALEFDGLASDFMFLKVLVFFGGTLGRKEIPKVREWEWGWFYKVLDVSSDLDPYFFDPYYFGNAILTWDAGMIREANLLLEKGSRYRDRDWLLPFYLGFNHFYFFQDSEKASEYLMESSRRPGASPITVSLATKLAHKAKRTETAIIFLEQILEKTEDARLRKEYETRLDGLRKLLYLERAVAFYKKKFGRTPVMLDELVKRGMIKAIPLDPYGGTFFIDRRGVVSSTSNFMTVYKSQR